MSITKRFLEITLGSAPLFTVYNNSALRFDRFLAAAPRFSKRSAVRKNRSCVSGAAMLYFWCTHQAREDVVCIGITSASLPAKKRILTVCVKLFLEKGYKRTTLAEIIEKADVSYSTFQNIFRAKDGVLTELAEFMFSNQFSMARSSRRFTSTRWRRRSR